MKHPVSAILLPLLCAAVSALAAAAAGPEPTGPDAGVAGKALFLLLGQSNMAGRGFLNATNRVPAERVAKLDRNDRWVPGEEPIHFDKPSAGAGPAASFARAVADRHPGVEIGLVPCAVGGSALAEWMPGAPLYAEAVRRAKIAQKDGTVRAILWHQGESDADRGPLEASYVERLAEMVAALRAELGLAAADAPFLFGEIGDFPGSPYRDGNRSFNAVLPAATNAIPNARLVPAADLRSNPDRIHFDTPSQRTLGLRYAAAFLEAAEPAPSPAPRSGAQP